MKMRSVAWLTMAVLLAACNNTPAPDAGAPAAPLGETATTMQPGTVPTDGATGTVPRVLDRAEILAEDLQDDLRAERWAAAEPRLAELRGLADSFRAVVPTDSVSTAYTRNLDALERAVQAHNRNAALQAANGVSRTLAAAFGGFGPRIPVPVAYMDVAGRDIVYAAERGDWTAAAHAVAEMRENFNAVQSHVQGADAALATHVEEQIHALDAAVRTHDTAVATRTADVLLEEVDAIEATY